MNRLHLALLLVLSLAVCSACGNLSNRQGASAPAANTNAQPARGDAGLAAQPDAPAPAARVFKGTIAYEYRVEMKLTRGPGDALAGSYFYEGKGGEIALRGTVDAGGKFTLREYAGDKQTGTFKGRWLERPYEPAATLEGDWTKAGAKEAQGFYLVEQYVATDAPYRLVRQAISEHDKERKYTVEAAYPQMEGGAGAEAFNRHVRELVETAVGQFKQGAGADPSETDYAPDAGEDTLNVTYDTRLATADFVSVEFQIEEYEHGAAHPGHSFEVVNFDLRAGRPVQLAELFKPDADYLPTLAARATDALRRWNKDSAADSGDNTPYLPEDFQGGADATPENYQLWALTPKGLAVRYDYYQVGPYAAGAPAVLVPYDELRAVLRADGPAAALGLKK
ncbi:MAG TPA: RsiV family protein [Pyrinomonadaceae bacterium]|jgi:hypothetical protein